MLCAPVYEYNKGFDDGFVYGYQNALKDMCDHFVVKDEDYTYPCIFPCEIDDFACKKKEEHGWV